MSGQKTLHRQVKYALLRCFLLPEEKKQELIEKLPNFDDEQLQKLLQTLEEYEKEAKPFVDAGFETEKGKEFFKELKNIHSDLKRNTSKQIEKEERGKETPEESLEEELKNL